MNLQLRQRVHNLRFEESGFGKYIFPLAQTVLEWQSPMQTILMEVGILVGPMLGPFIIGLLLEGAPGVAVPVNNQLQLFGLQAFDEFGSDLLEQSQRQKVGQKRMNRFARCCEFLRLGTHLSGPSLMLQALVDLPRVCDLVQEEYQTIAVNVERAARWYVLGGSRRVIRKIVDLAPQATIATRSVSSFGVGQEAFGGKHASPAFDAHDEEARV
jgi:hypothetical protein